MRCLIILTSIFWATSGFAQMIRCRGNIDFWIQSKKMTWQRIEMKNRAYFEDFESNVNTIRIGKKSQYPAAEIFPFLGIEFTITNKDVKIDTDKETWFAVQFEKHQLSCNIHSGTGE